MIRSDLFVCMLLIASGEWFTSARSNQTLFSTRLFKACYVGLYITLTAFILDFMQMSFDRTSRVIYEHNLRHFGFVVHRHQPLAVRSMVLLWSVLKCMLYPMVLLIGKACVFHLLSSFVEIRFVSFAERAFVWFTVTVCLASFILLNACGVLHHYARDPYVGHVLIYLCYGFCGLFL